MHDMCAFTDSNDTELTSRVCVCVNKMIKSLNLPRLAEEVIVILEEFRDVRSSTSRILIKKSHKLCLLFLTIPLPASVEGIKCSKHSYTALQI